MVRDTLLTLAAFTMLRAIGAFVGAQDVSSNSSTTSSLGSFAGVCKKSGLDAESQSYSGSLSDMNNAEVYKVQAGITPPKASYAPDPVYSDLARRAKYEGTVVLWLVVNAEGLPKHIRVSRSIGMGLDEKAVEAVEKWRFQPATKQGSPVSVMINVEVNFVEDKSGRRTSLCSPATGNTMPPTFSGVDTAKYPLAIYVEPADAVPTAGSYQLTTRATIDGAGAQRSIAIVCKVEDKTCLLLGAGQYPARWLQVNQRLEILGLRNSSKEKLQKAEYMIATDKQGRT